MKEVVPVREAELTLAVEVGWSFGDLRVVYRERSGKELQRRNCSAMDESGDFKFTSREKLLELGRMMELSGSELEEFVVEQQEHEQQRREAELEHKQRMKEIEESKREQIQEIEERQRQ